MEIKHPLKRENSLEDDLKIIQEYKSTNITIKELSKKHSLSLSRINRMLVEQKVSFNYGKCRKSKGQLASINFETWQLVLDLWKRNKSTKFIANTTDLTRFQIASMLIQSFEFDTRIERMVSKVLKTCCVGIDYSQVTYNLNKVYRKHRIHLIGYCNICNEKTKLFIDHDHVIGKVRGVLCTSCNNGAGSSEQDKNWFEKAFIYLQRNKSKNIIIEKAIQKDILNFYKNRKSKQFAVNNLAKKYGIPCCIIKMFLESKKQRCNSRLCLAHSFDITNPKCCSKEHIKYLWKKNKSIDYICKKLSISKIVVLSAIYDIIQHKMLEDIISKMLKDIAGNNYKYTIRFFRKIKIINVTTKL